MKNYTKVGIVLAAVTLLSVAANSAMAAGCSYVCFWDVWGNYICRWFCW